MEVSYWFAGSLLDNAVALSNVYLPDSEFLNEKYQNVFISTYIIVPWYFRSAINGSVLLRSPFLAAFCSKCRGM